MARAATQAQAAPALAAQAQAAPALAAFMARAAGQIPVLRTVKGALINSRVRVINSSRGDIRPTRSSLAVDNITCSPLACANETRSSQEGC